MRVGFLRSFRPLHQERKARSDPSLEAADEAPAAAELAEREDELVAALAERQVDGVVLRVDDAEEARVAEALRAAAAPQDPAVQEDADVVAVPDLQLLHLVAVG